MAGELQYRPFPYDDWGMIRNADGSMFATVSRPELYEGEFDQHREEETDPFAELARRVIFFEALERENATLRAALEPFARYKTADGLPNGFLRIPDQHPVLFNGPGDQTEFVITIGDFRRAAAAIRNMGGKG